MIFGGLVAFSALVVWTLRCNVKTFTQRRELICAINRVPLSRPVAEVFALWDQYDTVSYEEHLRSLFFFRDPMKLYPKALQAQFAASKGQVTA